MEPVEGKMARGLTVIERNVDAQIRLIEELLDLSRVETGKLSLAKRSIPLKSIVESAVDALRPAIAEKGLHLECQIDGNEASVMGDPNRLMQVFSNLLNNAMKFTPTGGQISVRLGRHDAGWRVSVGDNGDGIDPAFLPHVFDRFRQADSTSSRRHGGLGIGLTIVRHIVAMHGGTVAAESGGKGRGATFVVMLPAATAQPESIIPSAIDKPPKADDSEFAYSLENIRVLLVDDEPYTREVVTGMLERHGADVTAAATVREALQLFHAVKPDVVVSDLAMPDQDGFALLKEVRSLPIDQGGNTPAIALTAYVRAEDRAQALAAGFQAHIAKPVDPQKLAGAVHQCVRRSRTQRADEPGPQSAPMSISA
jgi:CheY-like chemotaxis protein